MGTGHFRMSRSPTWPPIPAPIVCAVNSFRNWMQPALCPPGRWRPLRPTLRPQPVLAPPADEKLYRSQATVQQKFFLAAMDELQKAGGRGSQGKKVESEVA